MTAADGIRLEYGQYRSVQLSSNTVRILAPERMVLVDAGGDPAGLRCHFEAFAAAQPEPPVPVCVALTHVHLDHVAGLTNGDALPSAMPFEIAAHADGLRALRMRDGTATLAELSHREFRAFRPAGWRMWTVLPKPGGSPVEPDRVLPLGGGVQLEAYCTPGHSPDSVTWRVGNQLFAGDLLAATAPIVAGIPGWDRRALLASLDRLEQLMAAYAIERVHVGHGPPMSPAAVAKVLARSRQEAGGLSGIQRVDADRLEYLAEYTDGFLRELHDLFAEMTERITRLTDRLTQLQEGRAADEVRAFDRSHEVRGLFAEFEQFRGASVGQGGGLLMAVMKSVQVMQRIHNLLAWERLEDVLDESFLRYVRTRVIDFIQRAKGLLPGGEHEDLDAVTLLQTYAGKLRAQQHPGDSIVEPAGGESEFRWRLIRHLAHTPSLGEAELVIEAPGAIVPICVDSVRLLDALTRMVEDGVRRGARRVRLVLGQGESGAWLDVDTGEAGWELPLPRAILRERMLARAGVRVSVEASGVVRLRFET